MSDQTAFKVLRLLLPPWRIVRSLRRGKEEEEEKTHCRKLGANKIPHNSKEQVSKDERMKGKMFVPSQW